VTQYNPNLVRHLHSSLALIIKPVVEEFPAYKFYVEGVNQEIASAFSTNSVLLRINGPGYYPGAGQDLYGLEVFLMVTELPRTTKATYSLFNVSGRLAQVLAGALPINKWGEDDSLIGCLSPDRVSKSWLSTNIYGIIEKDTQIRQVSVIGKYELTL